MKKQSYKNTRRNSEVKRALAAIISGGVKDPRIGPLTSVTAVEVAPDLRTCKAFISVYGDEKEKADTLAGLNSARGFIKSQLARAVNLRNTPEIHFILDQSIAYGAEMSKLIDEIAEQKLKDGLP